MQGRKTVQRPSGRLPQSSRRKWWQLRPSVEVTAEGQVLDVLPRESRPALKEDFYIGDRLCDEEKTPG